MSKKRKSPVGVKIFACLLLLGSLACFMLNWLKLCSYTGPDQVRTSPGEILQLLGMDADTVKSLVREEMYASGVRTDPAALNDLTDRLLDGHFKLPDLAVVFREGSDLAAAWRRPDLANTLILAQYAVWAAMGLLALLGLIALICQLTDHRWGILPYFLLGAAYVAGLLYLRREMNAYIAAESRTFLSAYGLESLVSYYGIDLEIVKMGIGAYLCPFLALLALLFMGIRKKKRRKAPATPYPARRVPDPEEDGEPVTVRISQPADFVQPAPRSADAWICPSCGASLQAGESYCDRCGSARPRRTPPFIYCPNCGKKLPADAAFCIDCGSRIPRHRPLPMEEDLFRLPDEDES